MRLKFLLASSGISLLIFAVSVIILPLKTIASSPDSISVSTVPENPNPNQNTTITLTSYTDDLNSVPISWSVNGKKSSSGIGETSFSLNAPALGSQTTIDATVSLSDGDIVKEIVIKPSITIMLWQANDSYVPPFYEGKAMPTPDSQIKVVALPEIETNAGLVNPTNMTYAWQLDYTADPTDSGYGKNYFTYTSDYLDASNTVSVTAATTDQNYSSTGSLNIATISPEIEFYKDDPNLGTLWNQALSDGNQISGNEIIQAAPYFISPKDLRIPFLTFDWYINGEQITVPDSSKNFFPVATQAGTSGTAAIKLEVSNTTKIVQDAIKTINVNF